MADKVGKMYLKRATPLNRLREAFAIGQQQIDDPNLQLNFLARAEKLDTFYSEFQTAHNQVISLIDEEQFDTEDKVRAEADRLYFSVKTLKSELDAKLSLNASIAADNSETSRKKANVKLPKLSLPQFDGNFMKWPAFFELFNSLVHLNETLSGVEKFQYLVVSLKGEPHSLVGNLPLTDSNYEIAYNSLKRRYQSKRYLATGYYQEICNAPPIGKPSANDLRALLNTFSENIAALEKQGFPVDAWDFLLFNILFNKIDVKTQTSFELAHSNIELPSFQQLTHFLEGQCKAFETVMLTNTAACKQRSLPGSQKHFRRSTSSFVTKAVSKATSSICPICSKFHFVYRCPSFLAQGSAERAARVMQHKLCQNCLSISHTLQRCNSKSVCRTCNERHHTLLHADRSPTSNDNVGGVPFSNADSTSQPASSLSVMTNTLNGGQATALLSTAVVDAKDSAGNFQKVRILLDPGSMANFISESCVQRLGLKRSRAHISVEGLNDMSSNLTKGITHCSIKPCALPEPLVDFDAVIVPKVCSDQPQVSLNKLSWPHIRHLHLADENFHVPGPVDILIGVEVVPYTIVSNPIVSSSNEPVAIQTIFGWILQGKANSLQQTHTPLLVGHLSVGPTLDRCLERFWDIEEIGTSPPLSQGDKTCETIYQNTVQREPSGRFMVSLPFKQDHPNLGNTYNQALRRFLLLESKLLRNTDLRTQYCDFMQDYLLAGHMSRIPLTQTKLSSAYYIPHHCVIKPDSTTTKLRVVFDASAKGPHGISLNETLYSGPKLQKDIFDVLLAFRSFPVVFVCDIKQMYRQIMVTPEHRDYQRILWRFDSNGPIAEYRLNTVTFGISSSPYLALRTLQELSQREQTNFPIASRVLSEHVYVDDIITGSNDLQSARCLQQELIDLLKRGGFELRKWASNHPDLLSAVSASDVQMSIDFDKEEPSFVKVLGLQWNPSSDSFTYWYTPVDKVLTKRSILSDIARIYDPLGFLTPCVLFAKHLMQQLWIDKTGWDEEPSPQKKFLWNQFKTELPSLSRLSIPRRLLTDQVSHLELHVFCDASQIGYGAVAYVRVKNALSEVKCFFVCGKSRVAPLKILSIPRLELCAAVLAADMVASVQKAYANLLSFDGIYAWSDSQVALSWISSGPHKWKTFVANRVSHITDILPATNWRYVPSEDNPADCASRGLTPSQLCDHHLWWNGPPWLTLESTNWPSSSRTLASVEVTCEEAKTSLCTTNNISIVDDLLLKFSSLIKVQNIIAYLFRFTQQMPSKNSGPISPTESEHALSVLIRHVQSKSFSDIFLCLEKNKPIPKPMRKLAPFLDEVGVLRVGGRLRHSALTLDVKHPILLPSSHRFTQLLIEHTHKINLHPGFKTLQYLLLQRFWILSPRKAIFRCLSKCIHCFRAKPTSFQPVMADLPAVRVSQVKPFSAVCLDYAGPFNIRTSRIRGARCTKSYICVFVCCAVKAIHLELVNDLSSESFLAALRRFISRRGRCSHIYSDQGTNFKGAYRQLTEYAQVAAQQLSLTWHFNPPSAPHFNGLAEAGVKSVKTHLVRVVGEQLLTYEEFCTLLTQIEALLNSRPLTAISSDPNDLTALTPSHFLTLEPSQNGFPEPDLTNIPVNRLNRWQQIQRMHAHFWKRWHQEYLHSLQQRSKWCTSVSNISINSLVLIKNELKPPLQWELARIIKLHPGADGVVRVATVKTAHGVYQRPVVKLCPLPVE